MAAEANSKKKRSLKNEEQPRSGKSFTCEVVLLDGEHVDVELDKNAEGKDLFEKVCKHLDLIEKDYFGLQYVDERIPQPLKCWLNHDKKISKQKKRGPWLFYFAVKFYPPDPTQLQESLTRCLVIMQTWEDILSGKLPAPFQTQALLGSYCVQAEVGDHDSSEHHGIDYVKDIPFTANQTSELLEKIVELHKQHKGQTPEEAEINYLENVKKLSMYGVDLHEAKDVNNVDIMVGVCASGLQVYREQLRISRFVWPQFLKISYKRKHFYIKIRPADNSGMENTVSFKLASHRLAKRLWKIWMEHHVFFRLREAEQPHNATVLRRLGSKFRYSRCSLYQARQSSQNLDRPDSYAEYSQPARCTEAAPSNGSPSVDESSSHPDHWKDDVDPAVRRSPSEDGEGRDKPDHIGQPTVISMDATLEREDMQGTTGLTPAEFQKKTEEDEKEREKREKEEKQEQSVSVEWREKGNDKYRSVFDGMAAPIRVMRLDDAIHCYERALSTATHDDEKSSACKNLAVAYWKMAKAGMESGWARHAISFNFKEALKYFQDAKEYGRDRDPAWHDSLLGLCNGCWDTLCDRVSEWEYEARLGELEKLILFHFDDATKASEYLDIANLYFHWSVTALGDQDYRQCLRLLGKVHFPLNEARRLGRGQGTVMEETQHLEEDVFVQHCVASSIQARVRGEELFADLLLDEEQVNMDMVWEVVDWLRQAALLTRERDLEQEARALSMLGKVYNKVLKMEDRAKTCLKKALELANSMVPRNFAGQEWYDFARSTLARYQEERKRVDDEEQRKKHDANLHLVKEELEVLKTKEESLSKVEFLKFIYTTHPPKNPQHKLAEISEKPEWTELKKLYQKAVVHYHPDKVQEDEHGVKWKTLTAEITKMLTRIYEYYKGC